jgi:hypothetical protein
MLTLSGERQHQLPKLSDKLKPKTVILTTSLVLGILFYSQSTKPPKTVELSVDNQSLSYTKRVERLADNYLYIAEEKTVTPGNICYRLTIFDCLEQFKPERPRQLMSLPPSKAINSDLRQLGYQARIDAIMFAQERAKDLKSNSSSI